MKRSLIIARNTFSLKRKRRRCGDEFKPHDRGRGSNSLGLFSFFYFFPSEIPVLGKKLGYETALEARQTFSNALRLNGDAFPPLPIYKRVARVLVRARKHLWAGTRISPYIYLRCVVAKVFRKRGERKKKTKQTAKESVTQTKIPRFVTGIQRRRVNSGSSQVDRIQCLRALFAPLLSSKRTRNIISFRIGEKRSSNFARILRAKNIDRRYFSKAGGRRGFQFERAVPRNLVPRRRNFGIGIRKFFSRCSPCINLPLSLHFCPVLALPSPTLVHRFNPPLPGF